jgi:hypothetical protein
VFKTHLAGRLTAMPVSAAVRAHLLAQSGDLVNLKIPEGLSGEAQAAIRQALRESFVAGFRVVVYLAAGLAAASALAAWVLIRGKPGRPPSQRTGRPGSR